jgi:hypothetical protein
MPFTAKVLSVNCSERDFFLGFGVVLSSVNFDESFLVRFPLMTGGVLNKAGGGVVGSSLAGTRYPG